ncbi:hypothetical protein J2S43_000277 [Catenuloplanes nepalensis]|uniref:Uncharacterized protein n=1 Tax=Catenuloplanes nepalensis TaxID=587533 RepID=A0ABT9MK17_9ACTN|nr:hypothetical protein [Catenuloplanes nepalensis]MDP9791765.1 hypothetical protein [Catenuloplanes nepalensis]
MTRLCAVAAPLLLLTYGLLRQLDDLDVARDAGHVTFLLAMLLFALLATLLRPLAGPSPLATTATAATVLGAACFGWVITGDLSGPLQLIGPLLFQFGLLTLLALLAHARPPRLPAWSPFAVLAGSVTIAAGLDLIPLAALAIGAGLAPLAFRQPLPAPR